MIYFYTKLKRKIYTLKFEIKKKKFSKTIDVKQHNNNNKKIINRKKLISLVKQIWDTLYIKQVHRN